MHIGCVILAGGKSSRMGQDKAMLTLNGKTFMDYICETCAEFEEKLIARGNQKEISQKDWRTISDIYMERGPIGGLHSALSVCQSDALFCISCDSPFVTSSLVEKLCKEMDDMTDAVVVMEENGRMHPLCAVYQKNVASILEEQICNGNNRMMEALRHIQVKYVNISNATVHQLSNINTQEAYQQCKKSIHPYDERKEG